MKNSQKRPTRKPVSGVAVGHWPAGPVAAVTKLVQEQNRGATATGYPEKDEKVVTDPGRGSNSKSF